MTLESRAAAVVWLMALAAGMVVTLGLPAAFSIVIDAVQFTWQLARLH